MVFIAVGYNSSEIAILIPFALIFIIAILVAVLLLYYFKLTKIYDYLLIGLTFIFGALYNLFFALLKINYPMDRLLHYQILHFLLLTIQFQFFIYAVRIKWSQPPKLLTGFGVAWYLTLVAFITQYQLVELPSTISWGTIILQKTEDETIGGVFILSNGTILFGWGFDLFLSLYRIFAFSLLLYFYLQFNVNLEDESVKRSAQLWIVANTLYLLPELIKVPFHLSVYFLPNVRIIISLITLLALLNVSYIAIRHSEAFLLSSVQLLRAAKLYQLVINKELTTNTVRFGMKGIIEYMEQLSAEKVKFLKWPEGCVKWSKHKIRHSYLNRID